ncbi:unnamed protein product [Paramecium pentaurelia]|uniref:Ion transport domain-containing protein n=1 Tax=Paramecium pentaurelia TaxID=43138 RepID=A0A8S1SBU1_9CILI|nr:unnamed protein product [Paramecium pentaurelia]
MEQDSKLSQFISPRQNAQQFLDQSETQKVNESQQKMISKSRIQKFRTEDFSLRRKLQNQSFFGKMKVICKGMQQYIYILLEDPNSSLIAYCLQFLLLTSILLSCIAIIVDSLMENNSNSQYDDISFYLEYYLFIFFGLEYILRMFSSTAFDSKLMGFILSPLNLIDLLAIMPFLFNLIFEGASLSGLRVIRIIRFMRVFRLFKLSRFMKDMLMIVDTVKHSAKDIIILITMFLFLVLFFSIVMYYLEYDENNIIEDEQKINSISEAVWWCIATMTTVGYGDKVPLSVPGKFVACIAAFLGITSISLPVAVMGMNLTQTLKEHEENIEIQKLKDQFVMENDTELINNKREQTQLNLKELKFMERRLEQLLENNQKVMDYVEQSQKLFDEVTQDLMSLYSALTEQLDLHIETKMKNLKARHRIMKMEKNLNQKKSIELSQIVSAFKEKQKLISQGSILMCEESQADVFSIASRQSKQYTARKSQKLRSKNTRGSYLCVINNSNHNPFKTQTDYNDPDPHQNSIIYAQVSSRNSALNQDMLIGGNAEFKFNLEESSGNIDEEDDNDNGYLKHLRLQIEKQYQKQQYMNCFDQQFFEYQSTDSKAIDQRYSQFNDIKYIKKSNEFIQETNTTNQEQCVYISNNYYYATQGSFIYKVAYACNAFEFINGLKWHNFKGFGIDENLYLKIKTYSLIYDKCVNNDELIKYFHKILQLVWIDTSIEKLQAARLLYNWINKNEQKQLTDKQICDLYSNLLSKIKSLKNKQTFKQRVHIMKIDFVIFQLYEYQHFPDFKKNCNVCKACQQHKSKYFCGGCFIFTGKRWSLCLDGCFSKFHQDPSKYLIRKRMKYIK